jgi:hypothetical protein
VPRTQVFFVYPDVAKAHLSGVENFPLPAVEKRIPQVVKFKKSSLHAKEYWGLSVVGDGLFVGKSTLNLPGVNGLFAERRFAKDEVITGYGGVTVTETFGQSLLGFGEYSHLKGMSSVPFAIDGIKNPSIAGVFGIQFANHNEKQVVTYNSKILFATVDKIHPVVVLVATRKITADEEIFCDYGKNWSSEFQQKKDT